MVTNDAVALADLLFPDDVSITEPKLVALSDIASDIVAARPHPATLTAQLRDEGLPRPILLVSVDGDGQPAYEALTERHLLPAFRQAGLEDVPAIIITPDQAQAMVETLAERFHDTEDPLERAWLCQATGRLARSADMTRDDMGRALGIARRTFYRYRSVLDLRPTLLRLLLADRLGLSHALACSKAPTHRQDEVAETVVSHSLSRREIQDLVGQLKQSPDAKLLDLVEEVLANRSAARAARAEPSHDPTTDLDYGRYTSQLNDSRRRTLERLAEKMHLDGLTVRRAALLLLADPRLVVPSAVAYAQYVSGKKLGRGVAQMELALARMRSAAEEGVTPNERKVLELVLHHVPIWAQELMTIVQQAPVSVGSSPDQ